MSYSTNARKIPNTTIIYYLLMSMLLCLEMHAFNNNAVKPVGHSPEVKSTVIEPHKSSPELEIPTITNNNTINIINDFMARWTYYGFVCHELTVEGGTPPYTWTDVGGTLNAEYAWQGLALDTVQCKGDTLFGVFGFFVYPESLWFKIAVEDYAGNCDTIEHIIYTNDSLNITTDTLPPAIAGQEYYAQIEHTGGTAPFHWWDTHRVLSDTLGLNLDYFTGEITGIPGRIGVFDCPVSIHDTTGKYFHDTLLLSIDIQEGCGDTDNNGDVNLLDITFLINYLYKDGPAPTIQYSGDVNSSGDTNLLDITFLISYLYKDGQFPYCPFS